MAIVKIEKHPFRGFLPENARVLIVGSFPGREITHKQLSEDEWFYGAKRNQFWKIICGVYNVELNSKMEKQLLFQTHGIAIADLFLKIRRRENNNGDANLEVIEYNTEEIRQILKSNKIRSVLFTSRFVEKEFLKFFPGIGFGECLPSPSPRYARMTLMEKIEVYKKKLPL